MCLKRGFVVVIATIFVACVVPSTIDAMFCGNRRRQHKPREFVFPSIELCARKKKQLCDVGPDVAHLIVEFGGSSEYEVEAPVRMHSTAIHQMSCAGSLVATTNSCGQSISFLDVVSKRRWHLQKPGYASAIALSPDGAKIACTLRSGSVGIYDVGTGGLVRLLCQHHDNACIERIYWPNVSHLITVSECKTVDINLLTNEKKVLPGATDSSFYTEQLCPPSGEHYMSVDSTHGIAFLRTEKNVIRIGRYQNGTFRQDKEFKVPYPLLDCAVAGAIESAGKLIYHMFLTTQFGGMFRLDISYNPKGPHTSTCRLLPLSVDCYFERPNRGSLLGVLREAFLCKSPYRLARMPDGDRIAVYKGDTIVLLCGHTVVKKVLNVPGRFNSQYSHIALDDTGDRVYLSDARGFLHILRKYSKSELVAAILGSCT